MHGSTIKTILDINSKIPGTALFGNNAGRAVYINDLSSYLNAIIPQRKVV
jgi:hypothetical protein